jgi:hypothetical protein
MNSRFLLPAFLACYENDLIPSEGADAAEEAQLLALAQSSGFFPRLQLFGGSSDAVKEGKIQIAHYGLVRAKDQIEDLGIEVEALVCAGHSKALDVSGETALTSYDPNSDLFKQIAAGSREENSRKMYGPEYFLYIPSIQEYVTFFMSSPTARRESGAMHARLRKAATLKAQLITGKKHKWHGPVITACTSAFEIPPVDEVQKQIQTFKDSEKSSNVEVSSTDTSNERAR